jgi:type I restriction enzyme S subunit
MNWPRVQLKQITSLGPQYGANASGVPWTGTRPRYVRITDIDQNGRLIQSDAVEADSEELGEFTLEEGDLLFARSGNTVGKTYRHSINNGACVFAGYLIRFRLDPQLADSKFIFFFTQSPNYKNWVSSKKRVAGQPNVNGSEYSSLTFPLPSPREQRRIVEILEQADALRQKRAEADAFADRILQALFHKLFGDPSKNPKGWPSGTIKQAGATVRYGLGQPPKTSDEGLPLLRATNLHRGQIFTDNMIRVRLEDIPPGRNAILKAEEVIVVRSGAYTGDAAQVTEEWEGSVAGYDLVVNPGEKLVGEFVESFLLTSFIQKNYFASIKARAGQPHLNADQVESTPLILPPKPLQEDFAKHVKALRKGRVQRHDASAKLNTIFATMLHRAFTGELTAQWREAHMKELLAEMEQQARLLRSNPNGRN